MIIFKNKILNKLITDQPIILLIINNNQFKQTLTKPNKYPEINQQELSTINKKVQTFLIFTTKFANNK